MLLAILFVKANLSARSACCISGVVLLGVIARPVPIIPMLHFVQLLGDVTREHHSRRFIQDVEGLEGALVWLIPGITSIHLRLL